MKKNIKKAILIIFAILVVLIIGIVKVRAALSVNENTTVEAMLNALNNGGLTGISNQIKNLNPFLYCDNYYIYLYKDATYTRTKTTEYPGTDTKNGYAKAYVLAAPGYVKSASTGGTPTTADERQWAWYYFRGDTTTENDLIKIAKEYQSYKNSEKKLEITDTSKAETTVSGNDVVYGPIKIQYTYSSVTSGSKSDEWGGFYYAFFDENGTNVSSKVRLCTLTGNTYNTIKSTKISSKDEKNGYYKVTSSEYSNKNLYIVANSGNVSEVTMKLQSNTVDYTAKVHNLDGTLSLSSEGFNRCTSCWNKTTYDLSTALNNTGLIYAYGGHFYKYGSTGTKLSATKTNNKVSLSGDIQSAGTSAESVTAYKKYDGTLTESYDLATASFKLKITKQTDGTYTCGYCGRKKISNNLRATHAKLHVKSVTAYRVTTYYYYKEDGCGTTVTSGKFPWVCGSEYHQGTKESQALILVETAENKKTIDTKLDLKMEFLASVQVKKEWLDGNNAYKTRPSEIEVKLLANGADTGQRLKLNQGNNWTGKFEKLKIKDDKGNKIEYTVQEVTDVTKDGYEFIGITTETKNSYKITNGLKTEVTVQKIWNDEENLDEYRKDPIIVTLYANGKSTGKTVSLSASNNWTAKFEGLYKCDSKGNVIDYTVQEENINNYTNEIKKNEDSKGNVTYIITNTHTPSYSGYTEITGKVWLDQPDGKGNDINGVLDSSEKGLSGIKVTLRDANGKQFDATSTTITVDDGTYVIKVNYDNSKNVYKLYENSETVKEKLRTAYIEFEYDGMKYTTVATSTTGANTSKATENETTRNKIDSTYTTTTKSTEKPETWTNTEITATTKNVISFENYADKTNTKREEVLKYCNGDGTYIRTNPSGAWNNIITQNHTCSNCSETGHTMRTYNIEVEKIQNVNLGLFEREQPDVAIFSDLTKVELTTNGQSYTYLYGVRGDASKDVGIKVKFQNKDTYTYRRPVNPADIAYIQQKANKDKMSLKVTYEVKVANLSTTLTTTIHSIANYFDNRYLLSKSGWTVEIGSDYNKVTNNADLNITLGPQTESSAIEFTYEVVTDTIYSIFNQEATLNNAVEIESYSTKYGEKTLYAEQRTGERANQPYAGYDYNSHPGNANIQLKEGKDGVKRLYSTDTNGNIIPTDKMEDDTDIAPSFVLCKDNTPKVLSGTVWEDTDDNPNDDERLGNGKFDNGEKLVQNVKVELYKVNEDGTLKLAKLYDTNGNSKDAVVYTDSNGKYSFEGVVTDAYYLKYTYGDNKTSLENGATTINGVKTPINARNYKSTIITDQTVRDILQKNYNDSDFNEKWHITHEAGYSVAVDDMQERLKIEDLKNANFDEVLNMAAYTKPFKLQVEYNSEESSKIEVTDSEKNNKVIEGNISVSNDLNKMDFGIIERPRENLYTQKTISYIKVKLANGQVLTEGDPRTQSLSYIKAMGFGQVINNSKDARKAIEKQLLIEVDSELIQGAQIEVSYEVTVTNDNEKDYDYGTINDYKDLNENNNITTSAKANYYYYGESGGLTELKATLEFVDYLDSKLVYSEEENTDWTTKDISDLKTAGLVSTSVESYMKQNDYKVLQSNNEGRMTLKRGETSTPLKMTVRKLLSSQAENVYTNGVEIIKIDSKTARTIHETRDGTQVEKTYKPGNYLPTTENFEQDEDRVKVIITPPTGITNYIITYVIAGLVGLLIIGVGIVFIKKKVMNK